MDVSSPETAPAMNRPVRHPLVRIAMIVLISCAVGPLVAGTLYWAQMMVSEAFKVSAQSSVALSDVPGIWAGTLLIAYVVGVPYALVTSGIFALVAVLAGLRQLTAALIIGLIPAVLYLTSATMVQPQWQSMAIFSAIACMIVAVTTTASWLLTRRWHSPSA